MKKKSSSISLGPGAASLILIFVVLSMAILAMLSLITARNDLRLSDRSAEVAQAVYRLNEQAETRCSQLDEMLAGCAGEAADDGAYLALVAEALPEGVTLDGRLLTWEESDGARTLSCALRAEPLGSAQRAVWARHSLASEIAGATLTSVILDDETFVDDESFEDSEFWDAEETLEFDD